MHGWVYWKFGKGNKTASSPVMEPCSPPSDERLLILQITPFFFVDSYIALETWKHAAKQEQEWLKWFFCSENMVDSLLWPAFNFGHGGMGNKNIPREFLSPEKKAAKMPYAAPSDFMASYIL